MIKFGLTELETRALTAISAGLSVGQCPTRAELADLLGIGNKSNAQRLIESLINKGHLVRLRYRAKGLALASGGGTPELSAPVAAALADFCTRRGEAPDAVIADAIMLHIDQVDAACERWGDA